MPDEEQEPDAETLEQRRRYQKTLDKINARTGDESADLLLDTTAEDSNWLHSMGEQEEGKK